MVDRLPDVTTADHVRSIVARGEDYGVLRALTDNGDLPAGLTKGRPNATQFVEVNRIAGCVVGVNVGRTYFAIGAADPNGRLFSSAGAMPRHLKGKALEGAREKHLMGQIAVHKRLPGVDGRVLLKRVAAEVSAWLDEVGVAKDEVRGITLSLPAPVSTTQSKVLTFSIEPGFDNIENVEGHFRLTLKGNLYPNLEKVILANDADVAARGEVRYGKAYGKKDVIALHAAYGVGAGIVSDGRVLRTGAGGGAGEIGHCVPRIMRDDGLAHGLFPLKPDDEAFTCSCHCWGHLEAMAGGAAIVNRLAMSIETVKPPPPERLAELLNDPNASVSETLDVLLEVISGPNPWRPGLDAVRDAGYMIGEAIHTLTHLMKPEAVFLCGKLSEAGRPFLDAVQEGFERPGSLQNYNPSIEFGLARSEFKRRLIMVRGAAMTAVRGTDPLVGEAYLEEREAERSQRLEGASVLTT